MHLASRSSHMSTGIRKLALAKFQCRGRVEENGSKLTCLSSWREIDSRGRITCMGCHKQKRGKMATLVNKRRES